MECKIRPWRLSDTESLAYALNNKNVMDNLRDGLPYPYTIDDGKAYIETMLNADSNKVFAFAITVDDVAVGSIGVFRKTNIHALTAELGYYIGEQYWGNDIGTQAVGQICHYVFEHTDIVRIFAEPFVQNVASCRILEKNGFVFEGTLRKNAYKNNKIMDMRMYALVKE